MVHSLIGEHVRINRFFLQLFFYGTILGEKREEKKRKEKKEKIKRKRRDHRHSLGNNFERFRLLWELISRFEDFRRRGKIFLSDSNFLVCSKFNHMQRDCTCACAVACLHPHNSISNVVASVTIHDDKYVYIYNFSEMWQKSMKPLWKVKGFFNRNIMESVLRVNRS